MRMKRDFSVEKILFCIASICSAFLFFCFLGKAYGSSTSSPSWYALIFGGARVLEDSSGGLKPIVSSQTPLGILVFSLTLVLTAFSLWLFASCLLRKEGSLLIRGFACFHLFLLISCLILVCLCPKVFASKDGLGSGSIVFIACASFIACLDAFGLFLSFNKRRRAKGNGK